MLCLLTDFFSLRCPFNFVNSDRSSLMRYNFFIIQFVPNYVCVSFTCSFDDGIRILFISFAAILSFSRTFEEFLHDLYPEVDECIRTQEK